jgi:hypothetical protein
MVRVRLCDIRVLGTGCVGLSVCVKENTQIYYVRNGRTSIAQQPTDALLWRASTRACDNKSRSANSSIVFSKQGKAGRQPRVAELASFELVWAAVPLINKSYKMT